MWAQTATFSDVTHAAAASATGFSYHFRYPRYFYHLLPDFCDVFSVMCNKVGM